MTTYKYYQPEYVSRFKCDGQKCSAKCCRRWKITIDSKTYEKYSHIKPKRAAKEITCHLSKFDGGGGYKVNLDKNLNCPFLTEDNWCKIQRKHGESFLSKTCATYPRRIANFYNFYERSLTLTCPVAAELILLEKEPLKFETVEIPEKVHSGYLISSPEVEQNKIEFIIDIQKTAIIILQERNLTIDQRLMMLGMYLDKLYESASVNVMTSDEFKQVNTVYQNSNFLQEQAAQFSAVLKLNTHNYIKIMIELLNSLYGKDSGNFQDLKERRILDAITNLLNLPTNENEPFKISEVALRYSSLNLEREKFLSRFSIIFENFLVNEFFLNLYPLRFGGNVNLSYAVFVTTYKILELVTFSMATENNSTNQDLISQIMWYVTNVDHNEIYLNKISEYMKDKSDILSIMQNMLQV